VHEVDVDITILAHDSWIRRHPLKLPSNLDLNIVGIPPKVHATHRDRTPLSGQHLHWQQKFERTSEWTPLMMGWLYKVVSYSHHNLVQPATAMRLEK